MYVLSILCDTQVILLWMMFMEEAMQLLCEDGEAIKMMTTW